MVHGVKRGLLRRENSFNSVTYFGSARTKQHFAAQVFHFISWRMNAEVYTSVVSFRAAGSWTQRVAKKPNHVPKLSWFGRLTKRSLAVLGRLRVLTREGFCSYHLPNKGLLDSIVCQIDQHDFASRKSPSNKNEAEDKVYLQRSRVEDETIDK